MLALFTFQLQRPNSEMNTEARSQFELEIILLLITGSILRVIWEKKECVVTYCIHNMELAHLGMSGRPRTRKSPLCQ